MDVKSESWTQQPISLVQAGQDGLSGVAWRRSKDEISGNRPPRAARPYSCIEGRLKDEWLQTLNNLQIFPLQQHLPPYLQENGTPESLSLVASSRSSLESLCSGTESTERAQIKTIPSTQRAKVCCLTPVRTGWLPLQRHVVKNERQNNAAQQDGLRCKVKLKPPITPVFTCDSVKGTEYESEPGDAIAGLGVKGMSGTIPIQADSKRKVTLAERDKDTALDRATSVKSTSPDRFLRQSPVHRRGSIPQVSLLTAPSVGDRTSPKHRSSIVSITITSRKVIRSSSMPDTSISGQERDELALNNHTSDPDFPNALCPTEVTPQRKALVVKITEEREETSRFLQTEAKNGPVCGFSPRRTNGETCFPTRMSPGPEAFNLPSMKNHPLQASSTLTGRDNHKLDMSEITHTKSYSQIPSCLPTQETQKPVVLRRKPTIIKVQEWTSRVDKDDNMKVRYRHSFNGTDMKPHLDNVCTLSGSEMQAANKKTNLYRSTVSLQMRSSNQLFLANPHSSRGSQPRRPASCYASLFSSAEPTVGGSYDDVTDSTISVLPHEANVAPPSTLNRCWSTKGGGGSYDRIYLRTGSSSLDKAQSKRESDLRNQPLTLIKVPESSTNETHDAIVALNAAAIIANIKLQSDQKKRTQSNGNSTGGRDSTSMCKPAGARTDNASIAERRITVSCPVESETATNMKPWNAESVPLETTNNLLSHPHTQSSCNAECKITVSNRRT